MPWVTLHALTRFVQSREPAGPFWPTPLTYMSLILSAAAPRTGNAAFAKEYNAAVPDTWWAPAGGASSQHACHCCTLWLVAWEQLAFRPCAREVGHPAAEASAHMQLYPALPMAAGT